jgi:putative tryptophan/tyrosine transport system substrate-binding protein
MIIRRREFISLLGSAAATWPVAAGAQQPATPVIGYFGAGAPETTTPEEMASFHQGLREAGFIEGRNVAIEYRWARGQFDRLPALAADLVSRRVAVIVSIGGGVTALAAKAATTTIPIVFMSGDTDPVEAGIVASLSRPGGNMTGISALFGALVAKRVELLHELVPTATVIGMLVNPKNVTAETHRRDMQDAARALRLQAEFVDAGSEIDFDAAFATLVQRRASGLVVAPDPFFNTQRARLVALAARHAIPATWEVREFVLDGGLMSCAASRPDGRRQLGAYVGRVLKGEKPADLPIQQPTKFELIVNLKAAKAIGLTIPETFLVRADEVIE